MALTIHIAQFYTNPMKYKLFVLFVQDAVHNFHSLTSGRLVCYGGAANFCQRFYGLRIWIMESLNLRQRNRKYGPANEFKSIRSQEKDHLTNHLETISSCEGQVIHVKNG
jgi:glucose-6-phosphate 1-dehydrogenase